MEGGKSDIFVPVISGKIKYERINCRNLHK